MQGHVLGNHGYVVLERVEVPVKILAVDGDVPLVERCAALSADSSVDFPEPLGPRTQTNSPGRTTKLMSSNSVSGWPVAASFTTRRRFRQVNSTLSTREQGKRARPSKTRA